MTKSASRSGFTMIELLVVVGMLALLAASMTTAISGANRRAYIQAATATAQEMTNAILSYENYAPSMELKDMDDQVATTSSLAFILGEGKNGLSGEKLPVLFNGQPSDDGRFLDPWGRPYYVTIKHGVIRMKNTGKTSLGSQVLLPNYNRRPAFEVEPSNE